MKKTLRLIITLDCNLSCSYCCNKLSEVNSKIVKTIVVYDGSINNKENIISMYRYHK